MRTNGSRVSFLVVAALCAATTLWGATSSAQNVNFARAPQQGSSRRPRVNHATEVRECVSMAYGAAPVQLGQPMQQGIAGGEFRRRFNATPRCGRVSWPEALQAATESGLVDGGSGSGGGSIARVPPPPSLAAPPLIGSPPSGPTATQQQVQAAVNAGHPPVIIEVRPDAGSAQATVVDAGVPDAGPPVVSPPRPTRCTTGRCADAGTPRG